MGNLGGKRDGAGRKPENNMPKKQCNFKLAEDVIDKLGALSEEGGVSKAAILEWYIRSINKLPKELTKT